MSEKERECYAPKQNNKEHRNSQKRSIILLKQETQKIQFSRDIPQEK